MRDAKLIPNPPRTPTAATPPPRSALRDAHTGRRAQRHSERLVTEWLRTLSTRRT